MCFLTCIEQGSSGGWPSSTFTCRRLIKISVACSFARVQVYIHIIEIQIHSFQYIHNTSSYVAGHHHQYRKRFLNPPVLSPRNRASHCVPQASAVSGPVKYARGTPHSVSVSHSQFAHGMWAYRPAQRKRGATGKDMLQRSVDLRVCVLAPARASMCVSKVSQYYIIHMCA